MKGSLICAQSLSEAEAGSDFGVIRTLATKVPGGWGIRGEKAWVWPARAIANLLVMYAQTEPGAHWYRRRELHSRPSLDGIEKFPAYDLIGGAALIGACGIRLRRVRVADRDLLAPRSRAFQEGPAKHFRRRASMSRQWRAPIREAMEAAGVEDSCQMVACGFGRRGSGHDLRLCRRLRHLTSMSSIRSSRDPKPLTIREPSAGYNGSGQGSNFPLGPEYSMMPLRTTTKPRRGVRMQALVFRRLAYVAQRVWPMPIPPPSGAEASFASRFLSLPSARRRSSLPFSSARDARGIVRRDIRAASAHRRSSPRPARPRESRQFRTSESPCPRSMPPRQVLGR